MGVDSLARRSWVFHFIASSQPQGEKGEILDYIDAQQRSVERALMRGKTVVITGGTSGSGEAAAEILAKKGARIVLVARDKTRGDATLARLRNSAPGVAHSIYFADLTRLAEMKRVAAQIADQEPRIDVLINNAGALFAQRRLTQDGLEFTFALNHMAYFVLTEGCASGC